MQGSGIPNRHVQILLVPGNNTPVATSVITHSAALDPQESKATGTFKLGLATYPALDVLRFSSSAQSNQSTNCQAQCGMCCEPARFPQTS
jgi:hypothetical protein